MKLKDLLVKLGSRDREPEPKKRYTSEFKLSNLLYLFVVGAVIYAVYFLASHDLTSMRRGIQHTREGAGVRLGWITPTPAPTFTPTLTPTPFPTNTPTLTPTPFPTNTPTPIPTDTSVPPPTLTPTPIPFFRQIAVLPFGSPVDWCVRLSGVDSVTIALSALTVYPSKTDNYIYLSFDALGLDLVVLRKGIFYSAKISECGYYNAP